MTVLFDASGGAMLHENGAAIRLPGEGNGVARA